MIKSFITMRQWLYSICLVDSEVKIFCSLFLKINIIAFMRVPKWLWKKEVKVSVFVSYKEIGRAMVHNVNGEIRTFQRLLFSKYNFKNYWRILKCLMQTLKHLWVFHAMVFDKKLDMRAQCSEEMTQLENIIWGPGSN